MGQCIAEREENLRWHDVDIKLFYSMEYASIFENMRQFCNSNHVAGLCHASLSADHPGDYVVVTFSFTDPVSAFAFKMRWA